MSKITNKMMKSVEELLKPYKNVYAADKSPLKSKLIDSPLGPLIGVSNDSDLLLLTFAESENVHREFKHITEVHSKSIIQDDDAPPLKSIESELDAYFKGELTEFKTPFEFDSGATEFQRAVWTEIYKITYGKTATYSDLAERIGKPKSFRAVANACGRNQIVIVIPCHRVVASGGGLGGYSSGTDKKITLLDIEK